MSDPLFVPRGVVVTAPSLTDALDNTVDKRLAQFAYKTPRFPEAIRARDLQSQPLQVQLETGRVWFLSNLKPYEAADSDPLVVMAAEAIASAFGSVLSLNTREILASSLPGPWMWREDLPPLDNGPGLLARLDALSFAIRQLAASRQDAVGHGQIGHNLPPLLTPEEEAAALRRVGDIRAALIANVEDRTFVTEDQKGALRVIMENTSSYILARSDDFIKAAVSEGGKTVGRYYVAAILVWYYGDLILTALSRK